MRKKQGELWEYLQSRKIIIDIIEVLKGSDGDGDVSTIRLGKGVSRLCG